eukprot:TRINITY_DN51380_c0_g1_i1.p1 TRINITY_DN51380_c0_g1~~TRINITY_DN51380_c0_g1_i1.p1  ORF type:complete len:373 (+),score=101.76 TRINITY_DN51380_c0_g1_i1:91-1209(+)
MPCSGRRSPTMLEKARRWLRSRDAMHVHMGAVPQAEPEEPRPRSAAAGRSGAAVRLVATLREGDTLGLTLGNDMVVQRIAGDSVFAAAGAARFVGWRIAAFCNHKVASIEELQAAFSAGRSVGLQQAAEQQQPQGSRSWEAVLTLAYGAASEADLIPEPRRTGAPLRTAAALRLRRSSQADAWGVTLRQLSPGVTVVQHCAAGGLAERAGCAALRNWRVARVKGTADESAPPPTMCDVRQSMRSLTEAVLLLVPLDLDALDVETTWSFLQSLPELAPEHYAALMRLSEVKADRSALQQKALERLQLEPAPLDSDEATCNICLDSLWGAEVSGERPCEVVRLPCGHQLHRECARGWIAAAPAAPRCPSCRSEL